MLNGPRASKKIQGERGQHERWPGAGRHRFAIPGGLSRSRDWHDRGRYVCCGRGFPDGCAALGLVDRYKFPHVYADYKELARDPDVEAVTITAPNALHCEMTIAMAQGGKHVICEKPLCVTPAEADAMIEACRANGVLLLYAEELFFTPKYRKAKEMADSGAFGKVHLIKQSEKHFGPHAEWFWDVKRAGGGALLDLGSHGIGFAWWFLGAPRY